MGGWESMGARYNTIPIHKDGYGTSGRGLGRPRVDEAWEKFDDHPEY